MTTTYYADLYEAVYTYELYGYTSPAPAYNRRGKPDDGWFDSVDEAKAWLLDAINEKLAIAEREDPRKSYRDGYYISHTWNGEEVTYLRGSVCPVTLDEEGTPFDHGQPVFETTTLPDYVKRALCKATNHSSIAELIAYELAEGWAIDRGAKRLWYYLTSAEQVQAELEERGYEVLGTEDVIIADTTFHVTHCKQK